MLFLCLFLSFVKLRKNSCQANIYYRVFVSFYVAVASNIRMFLDGMKEHLMTAKSEELKKTLADNQVNNYFVCVSFLCVVCGLLLLLSLFGVCVVCGLLF